ncbi:MAG: pilus assembly protein PilM [Dehalococcoidia bacterium]|nr:pilus assembly protein PilM [Dehalococcoidia bacterium]
MKANKGSQSGFLDIITAKKVVTLDIDSTTIRLLQARGGRVEKFASAALGSGLVKQGLITNPKAVGAAIKQLMKSSRIRAKKVVTGMSGLYTVNRVLQVPRLADRATKITIRLMVSQQIPVSTENLYISWQTMALIGKERQIFLVGSTHEPVDALMKTLEVAGLTPYVAELKAIALSRAVNQREALIINLAPAGMDIALVLDGMVQVIQSVSTAGGKDLGIKVSEIIKALGVVVDYYDSRFPLRPVSSTIDLILTGPGAGDQELVRGLGGKLSYPVKTLQPPFACPDGMPVDEYAVNMGMALWGKKAREGKGSKIGVVPLQVNILPVTNLTLTQIVKRVSFAFAVLVVSVLVYPMYQITVANMDHTSELRARAEVLDQLLKPRQAEIKQRDEMRETIQEYEALSGKLGTFIRDLRVIYDEAGKLGINVDTVSHDGKKITVSSSYISQTYTSFSEYREGFDSFARALEDSGMFSSVKMVPLTFPPKSVVQVELVPQK